MHYLHIMESTLFLDSKNMVQEKALSLVLSFIHLFSWNKLALVSSDFLYSWYNVTSSNNQFKYYHGEEWVTIPAEPDAYNIIEFNLEITRIIADRDDNDEIINIVIHLDQE